jgi:hypothetical protein
MARRQAPILHQTPPRVRPGTSGKGGNGAQPPALAWLSLGFSLLRLAVPTRLAIGGAAALLLWLCISWAFV